MVTVIEVVSPSNKSSGVGRESYLAKQRQVRSGPANLVEIDLLRAGQRVVAVPERILRASRPYDYLICVNRAAGTRGEFEVYPGSLRNRLPRVRIPLSDGDPDVGLDVQAVLNQTYVAGSYRERLRYDLPCQPPLSPDDQAWADELIRHAG